MLLDYDYRCWCFLINWEWDYYWWIIELFIYLYDFWEYFYCNKVWSFNDILRLKKVLVNLRVYFNDYCYKLLLEIDDLFLLLFKIDCYNFDYGNSWLFWFCIEIIMFDIPI